MVGRRRPLAGRTYLLTLDAVGDTLSGYLDGVPLFVVRDPAHPAGRIGLVGWGVPDVVLGPVEVAPAEWVTYHRIDPTLPPVADGTELRVHAGNAADWTAPPVPGRRELFVSELDAPGVRRLPADRPVELRVLDATGRPGHRRLFRPDAAFTPATVSVLRRPTGPGFALTEAGGVVRSGTYRLRLTYRRDNRVADPASDVLRRAGDATDEQVVLDLDA